MLKTPRRLFFDIETTGNRPGHDFVLEVAALAVNDEFVVTGEYEALVGLPEDAFDLAVKNDAVRAMHAASGLRTAVIDRYRQDPLPYHQQLIVVADQLVRFVEACGYGEGEVVLSGHSIHFDRGFVPTDLKALERMLHYRLCDVGAIRDFLSSVGVSPHEIPARPEMPHRALGDCRLELQEARDLVTAIRKQPWCPQAMVPSAFVPR